ncbi:F-box domain-containing protein [Psidium guajava]|nr:F-box domain-containing protein [Psidium guajava]
MSDCGDIVQQLEPDMSVKIFMYLDEPSDLARVCAVSRTWCQFAEAISATSTDNNPEESIQNTMEPRDRIQHRASYWSSKGESDPKVSESLVYKLNAKLCIITKIRIQPFQGHS